MQQLLFRAMPTAQAAAYRAGAPDANGQPPERVIAEAGRNPCRHCLCNIREGESMLILAYRPFDQLQPYAELGPIFLHGQACPRFTDSDGLPKMYTQTDGLLLRAYDARQRIVYGTGKWVPVAEIERRCRELLAREEVDQVHARSSGYNCFQFRVCAAEPCPS